MRPLSLNLFVNKRGSTRATTYRDVLARGMTSSGVGAFDGWDDDELRLDSSDDSDLDLVLMDNVVEEHERRRRAMSALTMSDEDQGAGASHVARGGENDEMKRKRESSQNYDVGVQPVSTTATSWRGGEVAVLHERNFLKRGGADSSNRMTPSTSKVSSKTPRASSAGKKARSRVHTMIEAGKNSGSGEDDSNIRELVRFLETRPQCVNVTWLDKRVEDNTVPPGFTVCPTLSEVLRRCGCGALFKHQANAIKAARSGKSVVIATPTASGKSMCYVIPIFEAIMEEKSNAKALLMFPLKALANDQLNKMRRFTECAQEMVFEMNTAAATAKSTKEKNIFLNERYPGIDMKRLQRLADAKMAVCDGDTADDVKAEIRKQGTQVILTNPDSLHHAMLPGHKSWGKKFWGNIKYVVLDEAHTHTGVAGSHVANVLRRLLRVCTLWDSSSRVEFICTSATISNPVAHVRRLTTRTPVCIDESGAPSGEKAMILWQPPAAEGPSGQGNSDENASSQTQRRSPYAEAADIITHLVQRNIRCLAFVSARKVADTVARDVKQLLAKVSRTDLVSKVDSYRAGYNQTERRALERRLQRGEISALVCTSALEMGIDVGALDATVHVGIPETASAMWQQAGRAGRRCGASVAIVVACERPLDHYYVSRADELFSRRPEEALCDPHNAAILEVHLPCAAKEVAIDLRGADSVIFSACKEDVIGELPQSFKSPLHLAVKRALGGNNKRTCVFNLATKTIECLPGLYPHRLVMLRGVQSDESWTLTDSTSEPHRILEKFEGHRAMSRLYVGCIHLVREGQFMVRKLDHENRIAYATAYDKLEATTTRERTEVVIISPDAKQGVEEILSKRVRATRVFLGSVHIIERVNGFIRRDHYSGKVVHEEMWAKPVVSAAFSTRAVWFDLPDEVVHRRVALDALKEATVGVQNMCVGLVGSIAMCDTRDIAGASIFPSSEAGYGGARTFLYDTTPHGIGLAEKVFENIEALWNKSLRTVEECACDSGCPSCIQAGPKGRDAGFAKKHSKVVLEGILGTWMDSAGLEKASRQATLEEKGLTTHPRALEEITTAQLEAATK